MASTARIQGAARPLYTDDHEHFRETVRRFLAEDVVPHYETWEQEGIVPRSIWRRAGDLGFLGIEVPEEHGGAGIDDFRFNAVFGEEVMRANVPGFGLGVTLHNDICVPYVLRYATDEQRARWLPGMVSGELIGGIGLSEPGAGSDLAAISTRGTPTDDGWSVSGSKTFISNGINGGLIITAVRTSDGDRHRGISLLVLEDGMTGFERGTNLRKTGLHAQDTAELYFTEVPVPRENLLGTEGDGFRQLMHNLPQERLSIAIAALAGARAVLGWTIDYVNDRPAFGGTLADLQNTRFVLADLSTQIEVTQAFLDDCVRGLDDDSLSPERAAMAKLACSEVQGRVVDRCVQLHGGYGFVAEYPVARAYADARITRIYGGASEVMKEIVARSIGLGSTR